MVPRLTHVVTDLEGTYLDGRFLSYSPKWTLPYAVKIISLDSEILLWETSLHQF